MEQQIKTTEVFGENIKAYNQGYDIIINQGGTGSSKTWSILQLLYIIAKHQRKVISVCSYALPHLKAGPMRDFDSVLLSAGENPEAIKNRTDNFYTINNSRVEFFGIEGNLARVHGPRRDILFINEANHKITYDVFDQLRTRTRESTFIDYNPTAEFWVHDKVMPNFKHAFIKSTFLSNPYLGQREMDRIIEKKNKPGFENWWKVYGLGEIGQLEGAIFRNWNFGKFDNTLPAGYGLDFGFHPDPDAMVKVAIDRKHKKIYADECFYRPEQSISELRENINKFVNPQDLIIADCAEPRLIRELQTTNNVRAVSKRETVVSWLRIMQEYEFIITERSFNLAKELQNYIWNDQRAGIPVDDFNHLIDSLRYWFMHTHVVRKGMRRLN